MFYLSTIGKRVEMSITVAGRFAVTALANRIIRPKEAAHRGRDCLSVLATWVFFHVRHPVERILRDGLTKPYAELAEESA